MKTVDSNVCGLSRLTQAPELFDVTKCDFEHKELLCIGVETEKSETDISK